MYEDVKSTLQSGAESKKNMTCKGEKKKIRNIHKNS